MEKEADLGGKFSRMPFAVVTVDLLTGREVVIRDGKVVDAVRASMAVPGVFAPVEMDLLIGFHRPSEAIEPGEQAAREALPRIRMLIE